jgi:mono/diheme cytochrome c family protein
MIVRRPVGMALLLTALAVVLAISAQPHDPDNWRVPDAAKKMTNRVPRTDAALAAGKSFFEENCAKCHGETGKGDGPDAMMYAITPADLTDAHMMGMMTDGEIFYKISEGRKPMPTFKEKLSEEQRWQVVHFVRTLAPKANHTPAAKKPAAKAKKAKIENRK